MMIVTESLFLLTGVFAGCCWFSEKLAKMQPLTLATIQIKLLLDFEIEIKGDIPIGVQLIKAIIFLQTNFN